MACLHESVNSRLLVRNAVPPSLGHVESALLNQVGVLLVCGRIIKFFLLKEQCDPFFVNQLLHYDLVGRDSLRLGNSSVLVVNRAIEFERLFNQL